MPTREVGPYVLAQTLGSFASSLLVAIVTNRRPRATPNPQATTAEFFLLALVVLSMTTSRDMAGNDRYGLAIGFTVQPSCSVRFSRTCCSATAGRSVASGSTS